MRSSVLARWRAACGVGGATLLLAGCAVLSAGPAEAPSIYDLTAPRDIGVVRASAGQYLVPEPTAVRAIDSDRIVVRPGGGEISYLAGAQWSDRLPKLVQSRLVETLENTGKVKAVGRPGQGLAIDWQIVTELRAFEVDLGAGRAKVTMSVKLMNDRNGRVVATEVFFAEVPVAGDSAGAVVKGLDDASDQVLAGAVKWVLAR
ncbi:MAG: membrane integrity-associated transporter subunit PqiC [Hyphomicrobiaceae bacterium]|nr:membrane integrity-associated transporter subunit PqiC [Hyphomicrobiaceae bacterium]